MTLVGVLRVGIHYINTHEDYQLFTKCFPNVSTLQYSGLLRPSPRGPRFNSRLPFPVTKNSFQQHPIRPCSITRKSVIHSLPGILQRPHRNKHSDNTVWCVCNVAARCAISNFQSMKMIKSNFREKRAKCHRNSRTMFKSAPCIINIRINYAPSA